MQKIRVAVLKGGESSEREISLISGNKVSENINRDKYKVIEYDSKNELYDLIQDIQDKEIDVVFPVLHGLFGEDGTIQGLLELLHIPYTGCGVLCSALAMDKIKTKQIIQSYNINTPKFEIYHNNLRYKLPCVIKPIASGSSVGVSIPETEEEFAAGIINAQAEGDVIMIEEFIKGREFTVGVIGPNEKPQVLPVTEIVSNISKFYNYQAKYEEGGSTHYCPAKINRPLTKKLQDIAKRVYQILGCEGMSRIDFIVSENDIPYFIEINTIPGMTDTSLLPEAAKAAGISFPNLLDNLIQWAIKKHG